MKRKKNINLLLSPKYCPEWGNWHVLREFIQNCKDADKEYSVEFPDDDNVTMTTKTNPTLSQLLMIGEGTKAGDDSMIGEFGEGSKIACLVAARSRMGLTIEVPEGTWTFSLKTAAGFDCKSLHATLDPNETYEGCRVKFKSNGIKQVFEKNFTDEPIGRLTKGNRLFVRGIFICELEKTALYSWNIRNIKLNRDRSIPCPFELKSALGRLALKDTKKNEWLIDEFFNNLGCFEMECLSWTYPNEEGLQRFAESFKRVFGENAVVASKDQKKNAVAGVKGYDPIVLPQNFDKYIKKCESVDELLDKQDSYVFMDKSKFSHHALEEIYQLMKMLGSKSKVEIYEEGTGSVGFYDNKNKTIGLCESKFSSGERINRLATLTHECSHELSQAGDQTLHFEFAQSQIAGILAAKALEGATNWG